MLERENKNNNGLSGSSKNGKGAKKTASRGTAVARKKRGSKSTSKKKAPYKIVSRSSVAPGTKKRTTRESSSAPAEPQPASLAPTPASSPPRFGTSAHESARPRMISAEERQQLIGKAAYHLALQRGFHTSDPQQNWIDAEAEVDSMLADSGGVPAE
jgi:hypothetical protein